MDRIRYLAASLLCLTGVIHVGRFGMADAPPLIVVGFGVVYLIIGGLLFRGSRAACYLGAVAPLVGLGIGPVIWKNPPIPLAAFLVTIEFAAVVSCLWLITKSLDFLSRRHRAHGEEL